MTYLIGIDRRIRPEGARDCVDNYKDELRQLQEIQDDDTQIEGGCNVQFPYRILGNGPMSASGYVINTNTKKVAYGFVAPRTGTISHVYWYLTVSVSQTMTTSIQADSSGNPSGTMLGSQTFTPAAVQWVNFGTPVSVTKGNIYWVVVQFTSTAGTVTANSNVTSGPAQHNFPSSKKFDGSSWSFVSANPYGVVGGIQYGSKYFFMHGVIPIRGFNQTSFSNATTNKYIGMALRCPFRCRLGAVSFCIESNADWEGIVYDFDGSTALWTSPTFLLGHRANTNTKWFDIPLGDDALFLEAGETYYLVARPKTSTAIKIPLTTVDPNVIGGFSATFSGNSDWEFYGVRATATPTGVGSWTVQSNGFYGVLPHLEALGY